MHRSWGPWTRLSTAQPSTVPSEKVPSCKRTRRRQDTDNEQNWLSRVATVFAAPERVQRKVTEVMDSLGTLVSKDGKLWVGFLSLLPRKSSSLLQAPTTLVIPLISARQGCHHSILLSGIFDLLLHWSYICCKAHKNISQPLTCESTFLAAHSGLSTGAHDCRVPDKPSLLVLSSSEQKKIIEVNKIIKPITGKILHSQHRAKRIHSH